MILVTGATGFVGGSLLRYFESHGLPASGISRARLHDLAELVAQLDPKTIVHAAGSASVAASISHPARDFEAQVALFQRLLEGVRLSGKKPRVIFLSSAAVYGNPERLPVTETAPLAPISPYGHHKALAEQLAREYAECFAIPTLVVRLFSLFGPTQRRLLLWELFDQFVHKPEVVVEGTGDEARDYLHIDDLAKILLSLAAAPLPPTLTVNVASGNCVTVRELVGKIGRILRSEKTVVFRGRTLPGNPTRWQADVSLLRRLIDLPAADFDDRLAANLGTWQA